MCCGWVSTLGVDSGLLFWQLDSPAPGSNIMCGGWVGSLPTLGVWIGSLTRPVQGSYMMCGGWVFTFGMYSGVLD